nr:toxin-activating lysine-acyltransferase [Andreprevotia sp. IGB-42]
MAAKVMSENLKYMQFQFAAIPQWIRIPVLHEQCKFFFDGGGDPVGFITWAMVSRKTLAAITRDKDYLLHASEWNDGNIVWVMDLCINRGYFKPVFEHLKTFDFGGNGVGSEGGHEIYSAKRKLDGSFIRIKKWR